MSDIQELADAIEKLRQTVDTLNERLDQSMPLEEDVLEAIRSGVNDAFRVHYDMPDVIASGVKDAFGGYLVGEAIEEGTRKAFDLWDEQIMNAITDGVREAMEKNR